MSIENVTEVKMNDTVTAVQEIKPEKTFFEKIVYFRTKIIKA